MCAYPDIDFFDTLLIKTLGPLAIVALFWTWPLSKIIQGKPYAGSRAEAAKLSLFLLELVLLSVSTSIMQCFSCDSIGGKLYLRAQLTLPCAGTRRNLHVLWASLMLLLYPVGVPLLMFALMYPKRHQIKTLMCVYGVPVVHSQRTGGYLTTPPLQGGSQDAGRRAIEHYQPQAH